MPVPPQEVRDAAARGLALRERQTPSNRAGTPVGLARARDLVNGRDLSLSTIRRMVSFFARHDTVAERRARREDPNSRALQAWLLWGGNPGRSWARRILRAATADQG